MKPRTVAVVLAALAAVVLASFLSILNRDLLLQPFWLTTGLSVPMFVALLAVFLAGFVPVTSRLVLDSVRRDLDERRTRRDLRQAESLEHSFRRAHDLLADGQLIKATKELAIVLDEKPDHFGALLLYGNCLRMRGEIDEAIATHQRAAAEHPRSVAILYELILDYEAKGEEAVAEEIRNRIVRDFPNRGLAVVRSRRDHAAHSGDWEQASRLQQEVDGRLESLGETTRGVPDSRRGLTYRRGVTLLEEDRAGDAAEVFSSLLRESPDFVPARIMLGEALLLQGREEEAIDQWREGFDRTRRPVFLRRIEDYFIDQERPERAIEWLRHLSATEEVSLLPRFFLGRLYYRLEMHDEAYKVLAPLADRLAAAPTYHYLLGRIHERRGEVARAAERYQAAARALGVHNAEYVCDRCGRRYEDWRDRCEGCGRWGTVELAVEEEQPPDDVGLARRAVYGDPPSAPAPG